MGEIQFEVVGSPEAYESARTYDFAEQKVVESKPQLQWVGDDLERLKFELMLHASFTNPAAQLALLRATAAEHLAQPLVFGDGGFRGFFVIESINVKSQQLSAGGAPISIRVALALKEWDADSILLSSAVPAATVSPLAIATTSPEVVGANALTPGVSALLSIPAAAGARGPNLEAGDVPATVIVRSTAR
ncbi:MAG: phage tail protein [Candidatus Binatus sp.]